MRLRFTPLLCVLALAAAAGCTAPGDDPAAAPVEVVRAFNAALSARELEAALARLEPGAVNFNFGSAHSFTGAPGVQEPLTSNLAQHWSGVAPLLYGSSRSYLRSVDTATAHVDGPLAVVWARVRTVMEPASGSATTREFAETYVLRLDAGVWRIAGMASSRTAR